MKPILYSWHARKTMAARDISGGDVEDLLRNYLNRWTASHHRGRPTPNRAVYQGSDLACVAEENSERILIITVLLKDQRQWTDEDARNRRGTADRSPG